MLCGLQRLTGSLQGSANAVSSLMGASTASLSHRLACMTTMGRRHIRLTKLRWLTMKSDGVCTAGLG